jgi:hypothetical protein
MLKIEFQAFPAGIMTSFFPALLHRICCFLPPVLLLHHFSIVRDCLDINLVDICAMAFFTLVRNELL